MGGFGGGRLRLAGRRNGFDFVLGGNDRVEFSYLKAGLREMTTAIQQKGLPND